jgi:hypothetical protein
VGSHLAYIITVSLPLQKMREVRAKGIIGGKRIISTPLKESFKIREVNHYLRPAPLCKDLGKRRDNDYKQAPRKRSYLRGIALGGSLMISARLRTADSPASRPCSGTGVPS